MWVTSGFPLAEKPPPAAAPTNSLPRRVVNSFLTFLQVTGLLPYCTTTAPPWKQLVFWILFAGMFGYLSWAFVGVVLEYIWRNPIRLADMGFFKLMCLVIMITIHVQPPLNVLIVAWKCRGLKQFLLQLWKALEETFTLEAFSGWRPVIVAVALMFPCILALSQTVSMIAMMLAAKESGGWNESPGVLEYCLNVLQALPVNNGQWAIPCFCTLVGAILLAVTAVISETDGEPESSLVEFGKNNMAADKQELVRKALVVKKLVRDYNDLFSYINLLWCLRELVSMVAVIAHVLRVPEAEGDLISKSTVLVLGFSAVTATHSVVRYWIFFSLEAKARKIRRNIEGVGETGHVLRGAPTEFAFAVSAGGFFNLNKDYIVTVFGLAVTYFVLIYQTRNAEIDKQQYVTIQNLQQTLRDVLQNMTLKDVVTP